MSTIASRKAVSATRRATNLSLDSALIESAKELGINISRACERGLAEQISEERGKRWLAENQAAIEGWNRYVEEHGLPLEKHRLF